MIEPMCNASAPAKTPRTTLIPEGTGRAISGAGLVSGFDNTDVFLICAFVFQELTVGTDKDVLSLVMAESIVIELWINTAFLKLAGSDVGAIG